MKRNKMGTIWFSIGLIPFMLTLTISVVAIFNGTSSCFLTTQYGLCDHIEGFKAFIQIWYLALNVLYPIYLVASFLIVLGANNYRIDQLSKNRMLIMFGSIPFILSISLFLLACIALNNTLYNIFISTFITHYFIVFTNFIGIFVILAGLSRINKEDNKKKENKKEDVD